jgi:hypothetical protein
MGDDEGVTFSHPIDTGPSSKLLSLKGEDRICCRRADRACSSTRPDRTGLPRSPCGCAHTEAMRSWLAWERFGVPSR